MILYLTDKVNGIYLTCLTDEALEQLTFDELVKKVVPEGQLFIKADDLKTPVDTVFIDAYKPVIKNNKFVDVKLSLDDAKDVIHEHRRIIRDALLEPLDKLTLIPPKAKEAEEKRQAIREQFDEFQIEIDNASDIDSLKQTMLKFRSINVLSNS